MGAEPPCAPLRTPLNAHDTILVPNEPTVPTASGVSPPRLDELSRSGLLA